MLEYKGVYSINCRCSGNIQVEPTEFENEKELMVECECCSILYTIINDL